MCLREKIGPDPRNFNQRVSLGRNDLLIRTFLVYVLEATVTEERRRLMMEIIYHKCEFVGEMTVVQQAQRQLSWRVMSVSSRP